MVVIGAGLAGLSAARLLNKHYGKQAGVVVLEARSTPGGRISNVQGLAPWPIEAGAEFIHGSKSSIKKLVDEIGCTHTEQSYPDYYYLGRDDKFLTSTQAHSNPHVQEAHDTFSGLVHEDITRPDSSIFDYMKHRKHASERSIELADCFYANDFGCSIHELGLQECIQEAKNWSYGQEYLLLDRPLSAVIDFLGQGLQIRVDSPVQKIEYSSEGVNIFLKNTNEIIVADYAVVAVPLTVLKREMIEFVPCLPEDKRKAIKSIGMSTALKVILAFTHRFWPEDMFHVLCSESFLPEVWTRSYPMDKNLINNNNNQGEPLGDHVLVGFVAGPAADATASLSKTEIFKRALKQFDNMFKRLVKSLDKYVEDPTWACSEPQHYISISGGGGVDSDRAQEPSPHKHTLLSRSELFPHTCSQSGTISMWDNPASYYFKGGCIVNWGDEPYIYGGYTHPSIHGHGARSKLAEPLSKRLFFAGEATHPGVNSCMHGALDTGLRAAQEVITQNHDHNMLSYKTITNVSEELSYTSPLCKDMNFLQALVQG